MNELRFVIKELRERTGLSQGMFASRFRIPVRTLQHWEQGRQEPPVYVLYMIEHILDLERDRDENIFDRINGSGSFEESRYDILSIAASSGMRDTISSILDSATTDYEVGMAVAKVFDAFGVVPTMEWLPDEIKALYSPSSH